MDKFFHFKKAADRFTTGSSRRRSRRRSRRSLSVICLSMSVTMLTGCFSGNSQSGESDVLFFGRALIGPDRSNDEMVLHFIVQGKDIYLDKNKDDKPDQDELLTANQLPPLVDPTTGVKYLVKEIRLGRSPQLVDEDFPQALGLTVEVDDNTVYSIGGSINLSADPQTPDWVHFAGILEFLFDPEEELFTVGSTTEIRVNVGTKGYGSALNLGANTDTDPLSKIDRDNIRISMMFPLETSIAPEVEVRIPAETEVFIKKLYLDRACCGDTFGGVLEIPDHVSAGQMELTFRFDKWPGTPIEPLAVKVPIVPNNQEMVPE